MTGDQLVFSLLCGVVGGALTFVWRSMVMPVLAERKANAEKANPDA